MTGQQALSPQQDKLVIHALGVLQRTSRTFQGIGDTSVSPTKPKLRSEGDELMNRVARNFVEAVTFLLTQRQLEPTTAGAAEALIHQAIHRLNDGLVTDQHGLWRAWETKVPTHPKPADIPAEMAKFYEEFAAKYRDPQIDPVAFAAWIEQRFNAEIHPLADGCGRTARGLAVFVLARAGLPYPDFPSRKAFFANIVGPLSEWTDYYRSLIRPVP